MEDGAILQKAVSEHHSYYCIFILMQLNWFLTKLHSKRLILLASSPKDF